MEKPSLEQRLLAHKLEEWNRLAAVVTHEINNPLAAIGNLLFLMQMMPGITPEIAGVTQQITDEVKRIEALTRLALGFLRQRTDPETVDLVAAAEGVRLLLGPALRQRRVKLEIRHDGDCTVQACGSDLRQVLLNLTRNACDASPKGSKITIGLTGTADQVVIDVEDQGQGISGEKQGQLFRVDGDGADEHGKGLDLWLTQRLVEAGGGAVQVDSTPGKGSRFSVVWPRRIAHTAPQSGHSAANSGPAPKA